MAVDLVSNGVKELENFILFSFDCFTFIDEKYLFFLAGLRMSFHTQGSPVLGKHFITKSYSQPPLNPLPYI